MWFRLAGLPSNPIVCFFFCCLTSCKVRCKIRSSLPVSLLLLWETTGALPAAGGVSYLCSFSSRHPEVVAGVRHAKLAACCSDTRLENVWLYQHGDVAVWVHDIGENESACLLFHVSCCYLKFETYGLSYIRATA